MKNRFRGYYPVVVDLETGGFNPNNNAILEIAITLIEEENENLTRKFRYTEKGEHARYRPS